MPKRLDEADELAAFSARDARWLYLADAALSASEKTIQALELAKEEQERIRKLNIKGFSYSPHAFRDSRRPGSLHCRP